MAKKLFLVLTLLFAVSVNGVARADINNATGTNVEEGNNRASTAQRGASTSGDANGGQVTGVVANGRTSVDATNHSANSSATSGDARGSNSSSTFTGLNRPEAGDTTITADINNVFAAVNVQEGDNRTTVDQSAAYSSGDAVTGQVIGAVTAASGSTSIVAANTSENVDATSGDARGDNAFAAFTGLDFPSDDEAILADINNVTGVELSNIQEGNNRTTERQDAAATTGDAVAGQIVGSVAAGATSIDATNSSTNSDVTTGDARADNGAAAFTGLTCLGGSSTITATDISNIDSNCNVQEGTNRTTGSQTARSSSGDGVAGEVIGSVTSAGGSASIVAANGSDNVNVTTGDPTADNSDAAFTGHNCQGGTQLIGASDLTNIGGNCNTQEGDNRTTSTQSTAATTGDGVAGQVIGAVSAGATSIDARNSSSNTDVTTGDADAHAAASAFTGLNCESDAQLVTASDLLNIGSNCDTQQGTNRTTSNQSVSATSGDGVGGEVIGAVTAAGGSTSIVAANTSEDVSVQSGDAASDAAFSAFTGHQCIGDDATVTATDLTNIGGNCDTQDGNNRATGNQTATSSTGDGVGGQVIGAVSAGATSIDATNRSASTDVQTGDADAHDAAALQVGHSCESDSLSILASDITNAGDSCAIQDGSNRGTATQNASATSGDGVGGEVIGAVTSAGGSASIVAANTTTNSDITTGDADAANAAAGFVGINETEGVGLTVADITNATGENIQDGNNRLSVGQIATASTGDGVAGQVLGVVSAGAASLDATNRTDDSSVNSGDARATNDASEFVGLNDSFAPVSIGDIASSSADANLQDGNNTKTQSQSANAASGDGVAGQVSGVVTSAGGAASVVLANTSSGIDATSGDGNFDNADASFVGQNASLGPLTIL